VFASGRHPLLGRLLVDFERLIEKADTADLDGIDGEGIDRDGIDDEGTGEVRTAIRCLKRVAPLLPGIYSVTYDGAIHGVHIDEIQKKLGWLVLAPVRKDKGGTYEAHFIEDKVITTPDGRTVTIPIYAKRGAAGTKILKEDGSYVFVAFDRIQTRRRGDGPYRFYNDYKTGPEFGGIVISVRLTGNDDDEARGINRAEWLRAIPPGDPDYERLYRANHPGSENQNSQIESYMDKGRAHSYGATAQLADLVGYAIGQLAEVWFRHTRK
jgi:hypothetical protein